MAAAQRECATSSPGNRRFLAGIAAEVPLLQPAWEVMTGLGTAVCRKAVAWSGRALSEIER